jgi:hypothetical protein
VELVDGVKALGVTVEVLEHHVLVFIGYMDIGNGGGIVNHLPRDFAFFVGHGPEHSGQQCCGQAKARAHSKKRSAIKHGISQELKLKKDGLAIIAKEGLGRLRFS